MSKKLLKAVKQQKKQSEPSKLQILGTLGVPLGGQRLVEVPNRNSFVYVQLRSNQNEVIQAFNNKVSPSYGLPVIVQREGTRYIVLGVDTQRYQSNWNSFSSYLPRHGNTHSFEPETGGGGDVTFVFSKQFMPLLSIPSGSLGGPNVIISPYTLKMDNGTWKYVGNTGTASLLQYIPTGSNAVMVLIYIDADTGNPGLVVGSGAYFANTITGAAGVVPFIPQISNPNWIPDAAIRLVTGTATIGWDNIYDVRQFLRYSPTGTSMFIQNNGASIGDASILNFIMYGANNISISGTTARIFVSGSGGGSASINTGTLDARYLKINTDNDPLTGPLQIIPTGAFRNALYAESDADDIVGDFEQLPTANGNVNEPLMFLYRGPFGVNTPFFTDEVIQARTDNPPTGTNAGGLLKYFVNGDSATELITSINPHIAGTGNAAMFDTTTALQWNGNLLLLKNAGSTRFQVNVSGTAYSNGEPLIKEAPTNGNLYARKDAGWASATPSDQWILALDTWTRTGNHSFTISSNVTGTYAKGSKVRYKDGGANEYGVIQSVSLVTGTTSVSLITNTNYAMAAATITDRYLSYGNPPDMPPWFDWFPTFTGFSSNPSGVHRWASTSPALLLLAIRHTVNGTSNATDFTITTPCVAGGVAGHKFVGAGQGVDNGAIVATPNMLEINQGASSMTLYKDFSGTLWTALGNKRLAAGTVYMEY